MQKRCPLCGKYYAGSYCPNCGMSDSATVYGPPPSDRRPKNDDSSFAEEREYDDSPTIYGPIMPRPNDKMNPSPRQPQKQKTHFVTQSGKGNVSNRAVVYGPPPVSERAAVRGSHPRNIKRCVYTCLIFVITFIVAFLVTYLILSKCILL